MKSFSLFIIITNISTILTLTSSTTCHVDDESALLSFKSDISSDPSGILKTWTHGTDCCTWNGISCRVDKRVTSISVYGDPEKPNAYLSGTISPNLSKLRYLDSIYLMNLRNLSGPFPSFVLGLTDLAYVYIENGKISGEIPKTIGKLTRLGAFSFEGNLLTGKIPTSISELTQLTQLKLGGNFLSGNVPVGIGRLKNLTLLSLGPNRLSGKLPEIFGSLTDLRVLRLSRNNFSGTIPETIALLAPKLIYLELGHNSFSGKIPEFIGKFKTLDTLDLSFNRFFGTLPKSFTNLTKIFNLDLSNNFLTDPFPVLSIKGIESLDLSNNQFHLGQIPSWVTSSPIIFSLKLAYCGIKMKLEDWKPQEVYFYDYIDLSGNEISGSPIALLNRTEYLVSFSGAGNKLKFDMGKLRFATTLKELDLSRNAVFGKVPGAVSGLEKLNVSYNNLCGQLPATKFPASAFVGNDCLCGSPLPACKKV